MIEPPFPRELVEQNRRALGLPPMLDERAAFETWFLDYCVQGPDEGPALFDQVADFWLDRRPEDRNYEDTRVRDLWTGWQGRASRPAPDASSTVAPAQSISDRPGESEGDPAGLAPAPRGE